MARVRIPGEGEINRTRIGDCVIKSAKLIVHPSKKVFIQYLYEDFLEKIAADMHQNVKNDYDNVVMIEGAEGSGKSNLVWNLLNAYDPGFSIRQAYVYNMDGMRERFASADYGGGLFWLDETSQIASNRTWQSKDNQDLVGILETSRSKGFTIIGCVPHIERVDIYLRESRMRYLLKCSPMSFPIDKGHKRARGYFELWKRNPETDRMEHVGYGEYNEMPPAAKAEYEPIKAEFQERFRRQIAEGNQTPTKYKEKYDNAQNKNTEIMTQLHDRKLVDDATLMDLFGYESKKTFLNAMSRARQRANE